MRPVLEVEVDVSRDEVVEVLFAEHDEMTRHSVWID
jgi:hypothetical protein